jgi:hypothetical protein
MVGKERLLLEVELQSVIDSITKLVNDIIVLFQLGTDHGRHCRRKTTAMVPPSTPTASPTQSRIISDISFLFIRIAKWRTVVLHHESDVAVVELAKNAVQLQLLTGCKGSNLRQEARY